VALEGRVGRADPAGVEGRTETATGLSTTTLVGAVGCQVTADTPDAAGLEGQMAPAGGMEVRRRMEASSGQSARWMVAYFTKLPPGTMLRSPSCGLCLQSTTGYLSQMSASWFPVLVSSTVEVCLSQLVHRPLFPALQPSN
jgi:hypothetical protein